MVRRAFFVGLLMVASCPVLDLGVAMWCLGSQTIVDSIWFWLRAGRPSAVEPTEIDMKTPQIDQHTTLEELSELITPPVSTSQHPVDPTMCRLLTVMTSTHESFRDPIFFGFTYREIRSDEEDAYRHWSCCGSGLYPKACVLSISLCNTRQARSV